MGTRIVLRKALLIAIGLVAVVLIGWLAPRLAPANLLAAPNVSPSATAPPGPQQYPIMDRVATKIIEKYQNSTCDQLWQERAQGKTNPKSPEEQRVIGFLHDDAQMRTAFINKIAAPIANKMFECGMIP